MPPTTEPESTTEQPTTGRWSEIPDDHPLSEQIASRYKRNTLPRKIGANSVGLVHYRSDYELRWLRQAKKARCYWSRFIDPIGIKRALRGVEPTYESVAKAVLESVHVAQIASKELREWCERERALLRIARPAAVTVKEKRGVQAPVVEAVTITEHQPVQGDAT